MTSETLWDARDVAAYLKVSRCWVYRAAERGDLPTLSIGALVRFDPGEIRAWAKGTRPASAQVIPLQSGGSATVNGDKG